MVAYLRQQLQEYHYIGAEHWKENVVAVITPEMVIWTKI